MIAGTSSQHPRQEPTGTTATPVYSLGTVSLDQSSWDSPAQPIHTPPSTTRTNRSTSWSFPIGCLSRHTTASLTWCTTLTSWATCPPSSTEGRDCSKWRTSTTWPGHGRQPRPGHRWARSEWRGTDGTGSGSSACPRSAPSGFSSTVMSFRWIFILLRFGF